MNVAEIFEDRLARVERRNRVLTALVTDRNVGGNPRTGMVINDATGVERFGLGLQAYLDEQNSSVAGAH